MVGALGVEKFGFECSMCDQRLTSPDLEGKLDVVLLI